MFKIRVHVQNESEFMDDEVYVEIELPTVPRKGDYLNLTEDAILLLQERATQSIVSAEKYFPRWFYGKYRDNDVISSNDLKDLSFEYVVLVVEVLFNEGEDFIDIELDEDI